MSSYCGRIIGIDIKTAIHHSENVKTLPYTLEDIKFHSIMIEIKLHMTKWHNNVQCLSLAQKDRDLFPKNFTDLMKPTV